jgi:hypothetical protein
MSTARPTAPRAQLVRLITAACVFLAACGGGGGGGNGVTPPPTPVLTTLSVAISPTSVQAGQTASASASGLDQNGAAISTGTVTWSAGTPNVASITSGGAITTLAAGQSQIIATAGGKTGQATLTVTAIPVTTTVTVSLSASSVIQGQTVTATATALDQNGAVLTGGTVAWSTASSAIATVTSAGVVTGVAAGQTQVIATIDGKTGQTALTVTPLPVAVASVTVAPANGSIAAGATLQLIATTRDASNNVLTGRVVTWATSDLTKATVSSTGLVTGVAAGTATITATSETKSGTSAITVTANAQLCSSQTALQLALGEVRTLTAAQVASLCLGGGVSATEYALIPFNNSTVAAATTPLQLTATNTSAILAAPLAAQIGGSGNPSIQLAPPPAAARIGEMAFRERERRELAPLLARTRRPAASFVPQHLTGIPATPTVGSTVTINGNLTSLCGAKQMRTARVVSVGSKVIVLVDVAAPAGGYTDAEMAAYGSSFNDIGYDMDVLNFGAPTDLDNNGRVAVFFTPMVNQIPIGAGYVAGLQTSRDILPIASCPGSNEGEMFYMAVPDPTSSNSGYTNKTSLGLGVLPTLAHEFQHLINAGRRIYVNLAPITQEEVWLNEGLSHIAEELLYYKVSGNSPHSNIDLNFVRTTQAQLDAINTYQLQNLGRLLSYQESPEFNSPYAQVDGLEMRGAIWELLRYSVDRKGGSEQALWFALVNSTTAGQANFNAVLGDITTLSRDWAVAQFTDDAGLGVAANYTYPSWNFRSLLPAINSPKVFPLLTHALLGSPVSVSLNGGGAAYFRFRVAAGVPATVAATSSGLAVPSNVDFILVRTQ